jgi:hypothetical protein
MEKRGESAAMLNKRMDKIEENSEQVTNLTVHKIKNFHKFLVNCATTVGKKFPIILQSPPMISYDT